MMHAPASATRAFESARFSSWTTWWLLGAAAVVFGSALRAWVPDPSASEPICLMRGVLHVGCPTCGMTRALVMLVRGDLSASLALHPMVALLLIQALAGWAMWGVKLARRPTSERLLPDPSASQGWVPVVIVANSGALLTIWIVRLFTGTLPV